MQDFVKITDEEVNNLLTWDSTINVVKQALISISNSSVDGSTSSKTGPISVQTPRTFTFLPARSDFLLCMPSYVKGLDLGNGKQESSLACKLLTGFDGNRMRNPPLATTNGTVLLFDDETGKIIAMLDADRLTQWRTAAMSCIAAQLLGEKADSAGRVLAVLGAGAQGKIHVQAFLNKFKFQEVRIWNRTTETARALVAKLKGQGVRAHLSLTAQDCCQPADVIITATSATKMLVQDDWVKGDALLIQIGVGGTGELSPELFKRGLVYVESREGAKKEAPYVGEVQGELGELALGQIPTPPANKIRIFCSLGSAVEDAALARLLYNLKTKAREGPPLFQTESTIWTKC